jgi:flagellar protein FliS
MESSAQDTYLESKVLSADSVELVQILYQAALASVEKARRHLREGDIAARSKQISKAVAILTELALSLDHSAGGDLSRTLLELYDYMQRRLLEANLRQNERLLAEVSALLATLLEGWLNCKSPARPWAEAPGPISDPRDDGKLVAVTY